MASTTSPAHHALRTQDLVPFHNPRRGAGKVVVVGSEQSRMLRGLAAEQRATGLAARHGDALARWRQCVLDRPCRRRCSRS